MRCVSPFTLSSEDEALMQDLMLFIDGSVHAQSKLGYGAYLVVSDLCLELESLSQRVFVKRFTQTSSTKLELQTLLWALSEVQSADPGLVIYTDSENIIGLPGRREQLERNDYRSSRGRLLNQSRPVPGVLPADGFAGL